MISELKPKTLRCVVMLMAMVEESNYLAEASY